MPVLGKELMCYCFMILCSSVLSQRLQQCSVPVSGGEGLTCHVLVHYLILQCPKPMILAVVGACVRGGMDMLLVHDLVLQCPKPVIAAALSAH